MTLQMLLVDDEILSIEGVKADLNLEKLHIGHLFTALNIRQAKEVFEANSIDILLCDIEMPQGNGLELLAWVREYSPGTVTIFLTSHADFKYAREALSLGCLDYLLKPVLAEELESVIQKARGVIDQHDESNRNRLSHRLWMKHHSLIIERFWSDLINRATPGSRSSVRQQIERHQIPIPEDSFVMPVLISVKNWDDELQFRDKKILEYALKKTAEEMLMDVREKGIVFHVKPELLLVLYICDRHEQWDYPYLHDLYRKYIQFCNRHFFCVLSCYLGSPVEICDLADKVSLLKQRDADNVAFVNRTFGEDQPFETAESTQMPELSIWLSYLKRGSQEELIQSAEDFLDQLVIRGSINASILHQFHQDFMQAIYSYLNQHEIQAHQLFGDVKSRHLNEMAGRSVQDMLIWIRHVVWKALHQAEVVKEFDSVVQIIQRYVAAHIDQDLPRTMLAEQVFLNPDYLSRLFKKETGHCLSDYVILERIKLAQKLLRETQIPVSSVAISVGYSNFSHFTKIFKKYAECGPTEYRLQYKSQSVR